ncbi:hypothetical protein ACFL6S_21115 [Candidatus Poribacteria bacterium]
MRRSLMMFLVFSPVFVVFGLTAARAYAEKLPWENLPFSFSPLVQDGTENLLPNTDSQDGLEGWNPKGDVSVGAIGGKNILRLGPRRDNETASIRRGLSASPDRVYQLSFRFQFTSGVEFDYQGSFPGLHGWFVPHGPDGQTAGAVRILEQRQLPKGDPEDPGTWLKYHARLFVPANVNQLSFSVEFNATAGDVLLTDFDLHEEKVEANKGRQILVTDTHNHAELPRHREPEPPSGVTVFHRSDSDEIFFYSRPQEDEIQKPLYLTATGGEVAVTTLAVYTPRSLSQLRLDISELKRDDGSLLSARIQWSAVEYSPRRSDYYGRGLTFRWVPDFFLSRPGGIDSPADETQVFWIQCSIPREAQPGYYTGNVLVSAQGIEPISVPIQVEIYPFQLAIPESKRWALYSDAGRWQRMTDEQVIRELRDMKAHGIDSILMPSRGEVELDNTGVFTKWSFDDLTYRAMPLIKEAGLRGPYLLWFGRLEESLATKLGIEDDIIQGSPENWPEKLRLAYRDTLRAVKSEFEQQDWGEPVYMGIDEPGYWKEGSLEIFTWQYSTAKEAGIAAYCTSSYPPSDPFGKYLKYHCYGSGVLTEPSHTAEILSQTHAVDQKMWYYATGTYSDQIGNLVQNRYLSGFLFYRSGADGAMSWTFQRPRGDNAFDDFVATEHSQSCLTYPDPEHPGENLDTPHWEGIRQGWLDYCYATTLALAIEKARSEPGSRELAESVEREFAELLNDMPWSGDVFRDKYVTNLLCDQWRSRIAALINKI